MLNIDKIILDLLNTEKENGNELLKHFHIQYPNKRIAQEGNNIFVACVSSENDLDGFDFTSFTDLVEILIVTKKLDYEKAILLIKNVSLEICRIIWENRNEFPSKPLIQTINPELNFDFVLTRGHIMVQVKGEPTKFEVDEEEFDVCKVILNDITED